MILYNDVDGFMNLENSARRWRQGIFSLGMAATLSSAIAAEFRFAEATIDDLQRQMVSGTLTARELTAAYLKRIADVDADGPRLNAVIELNPEALALAERMDVERKSGRVRGPLHGIPVLIKDNIDTADQMSTTAGSLALVGARPPRDAFIVARLREAGAVLLGKTNLSEWANYRSTQSISGWSGRGGQTRNPYVLARNPSGSSSGSAAAVSANFCVVAIGTETSGSIMSPASACGVVGVKPTVGWVSRDGIVPLSATQDTAGPITRTVRDAALVLAAIAGTDMRDAATRSIPAGMSMDPGAVVGGDALKGARLGVVRGPFGLHPRMDAVVDDVIAKLRAAGAIVVDRVAVETLGRYGAAQREVFLYEFKAGLNRYLAEPGRTAPVKTLAEIIAFNAANQQTELPLFGQELLVMAEAKGPLSEKGYEDARATLFRLARTEGLDATMDAHGLDALVMLTRGPAHLTDAVNGDYSTGGSASLAAAALCPAVTVPATMVSGLPVGVSFVGRAWSDRQMLALAADFELKTRARVPPLFRPYD